MPEADKLDYAINGSSLPRGSGADLAEGQQVAAGGKGLAEPEQTEDVVSSDPLSSISADATQDEADQELYAPTDFPGRPITHGANFGPGANTVAMPNETEQDYMLRVARGVMNTTGMPDDLKIWATRVAAGY